MKQHNLINSVLSDLISKKYISASFLVGSYARRTEDENSNIDLYIILEEGKYDNYISDIGKILEKQGRIIYIKSFEKNHYLMSIDCIYDDNIRLKLNNIFLDDFNINEINNDILKLYDPNCILGNVMNYSLSFTEREVGELIQSFCLNVYEFNRSYLRHDLAIMLKIASDCFDSFSYIIRYFYDKETSKLGKKEILAYLSQEKRVKYVEIIKNFKVDTLKEAVLLMMEEVKELSSQMSLNVASYYDYDLMMHVYKRLKIM